MYTFRDINDASEHKVLPSEALKLNGEYIENLIPGYRTVNVTGREALSPELDFYETGIRDGSALKYKRYPARYITVGYQLIAASNEAFREAYNTLAALLDVTDAEMIFNDEPDKFFVGTPSAIGEVEPGRNAVLGEIEFVCTDPFKYSVQEYEVEPTLDGGTTFAVNYKGTYKAFPQLEAKFFEESENRGNTGTALTGKGDCGFVAFFNDEEKIIQAGNPDEVDGETMAASQQLINAVFNKSDAWGTAAKNQWAVNSDKVPPDAYHTYTGNVGLQVPATGEYYLKATNYGSGDQYHGPTILREIPADATGVKGAKNFRVSWKHKMSIGNGKNDTAQRGGFRMQLLDASKNIVCAVNIWKGSAGKTGTLRFFANNKTIETFDFDLSFHNKYLGNNKYENGKAVISTVKTCSIQKMGAKLNFDVGGFVYSANVPSIADMTVSYVSFTFTQSKTYAPFTYNGIYWVKFTKDNCNTFKDIPNVFGSNDVLVADCKDGEIYLNDAKAPWLGALGNDWEGFFLKPGLNQIGVTYSDWVSDAYAPEFKMRFREVFL